MTSSVFALLILTTVSQAPATADSSPRAQALIKEAIASVKDTPEADRNRKLDLFTLVLAKAGDITGATEAVRLITAEDDRQTAMAGIEFDRVIAGNGGWLRYLKWDLTVEIAGRLSRQGKAAKAREIVARECGRHIETVDPHMRLFAMEAVAREQLLIGDRDGAKQTLRRPFGPAAPMITPEEFTRELAEVVVLQAKAGDAEGVDATEVRLRKSFAQLNAPPIRMEALAQLTYARALRNTYMHMDLQGEDVPVSVEAVAQLSRARAILGQREKAEALLKEAEAINPLAGPTHSPTWRGMSRIGGARWALGDVESAREAYRQAVEDAEIYNTRQVAREQASDGDVDGALATAQTLSPGEGRSALVLIALAAGETGDFDKAVRVAASWADDSFRLAALARVAEAAADAGAVEAGVRALTPVLSAPIKDLFVNDVTELQVRLGDERGALAKTAKFTDKWSHAYALLGVAEGIMHRERIEAMKARLGVRGDG
jgi:tetratricopeptide (TPR) repeat protein